MSRLVHLPWLYCYKLHPVLSEGLLQIPSAEEGGRELFNLEPPSVCIVHAYLRPQDLHPLD